MRSVLALGLLIALCASANAAARGHHAKPRQGIVRPGRPAIPSQVTPGGVYRDDSVPGGFRTYHDDPLPTMTHPSLAAADPRRADDVYAGARETPALRGPCKKKQGRSFKPGS
jgi:hypothetical protein